MITIEFLNQIPGRPELMLPWRATNTSQVDIHYLECVGDGEDLGDDFQITLCWFDDQPPQAASLNCSLPDFGPGTPIWGQIVDYARAVHKAVQELEGK